MTLVDEGHVGTTKEKLLELTTRRVARLEAERIEKIGIHAADVGNDADNAPARQMRADPEDRAEALDIVICKANEPLLVDLEDIAPIEHADGHGVGVRMRDDAHPSDVSRGGRE